MSRKAILRKAIRLPRVLVVACADCSRTASPRWLVRALMEGLERGRCEMFLLLPRPESFRTIDCKSRGLEGEALDKIYVFPLLSPAEVR